MLTPPWAIFPTSKLNYRPKPPSFNHRSCSYQHRLFSDCTNTKVK